MINSQELTYYQERLQDNEEAKAYLIQRGIDADLWECWGLGYDEQENRIVFQVPEKGSAIFRALNKKTERKYENSYGFKKGETLYGLKKASDSISELNSVIIVEGCIDCILMHKAGFKNTVSTMTCNLSNGQVDLLSVKSIYIMYDADDAGRKGAFKATETAFKAGIEEVYIVTLPEGKDPADLICEGNTEAINSCIDSAKKQVNIKSINLYEEPEEPKLNEVAYHGLIGDIVKTIEPETESAPEAILISLLCFIGASLGRSYYQTIDATRHHSNIFAVVVGATSSGRKGTGLAHAKNVIEILDPKLHGNNFLSGLSSGEGLISAVRDPEYKETEEDCPELIEPGIDDKRVVAIESEYSTVLKQSSRTGNILSAIIRDSWDGGNLRVMTKNNPLKATEAHISILGHITRHELEKELTESEKANGFANRFLYVHSKRSKLLPHGGDLDFDKIRTYAEKLKSNIDNCDKGEVVLNVEAKKYWEVHYRRLTADMPGITGLLSARAAPYAKRLAMIYAICDGNNVIRKEHLEAAIAIVDYSTATCKYLFGNKSEYDDAEKVIELLQHNPDGITKTDISSLFNKHKSASEINYIIDTLSNKNLIDVESEKTKGKPKTIIRLNQS